MYLIKTIKKTLPIKLRLIDIRKKVDKFVILILNKMNIFTLFRQFVAAYKVYPN